MLILAWWTQAQLQKACKVIKRHASVLAEQQRSSSCHSLPAELRAQFDFTSLTKNRYKQPADNILVAPEPVFGPRVGQDIGNTFGFFEGEGLPTA